MPVKLNQSAFEHARELIGLDHFVLDDRDAWSEHQPSAGQENDYIREHGWGEYAKWHLGIDDDEDEESTRRYHFRYGDFRDVHRCGVLTAQNSAGQHKCQDIEAAAADLNDMLEAQLNINPGAVS